MGQITIQKGVPYVSDRATFRSSEVRTYGTLVFLQGTTTPNDGGQCFYQASLTDTTSADNGASILVDLTGTRWIQATLPETSPGGVLPIVEGGTSANTAVGALDALFLKGADIASAATTDLSTATGQFVNITGVVTITSFGTLAAGNIRLLKFGGALTLTYDAAALILPGQANITTAAGDTAIMLSLGAGNWQCLVYTQISGGSPGVLPIAEGGTGKTTSVAAWDALGAQGADIASASTTNLATATGPYVNVTGAVTITALGTVAAGTTRVVKFTGAPLLTYNASSLILPGAANIQAAANDSATFVSLGSGNWICVAYEPANALPIVTTTIAKGGTGQTTSVAAFNALQAKGADIASASTTDLSTATGPFVNITGAVTITAFGTVAAGTQVLLRFTGAPLLTYNGSSLILPSSANIQAAAGDTALMESLGSGNWRCLDYQPFAATPIVTVPANKGGTGIASYAVGDLLYASGATALSALSDVAVGSVLASGGVTTAPTWTPIDQVRSALTTQTGTYSILTADQYVICTTAAFTATLPTAASVSGRTYTIKNGNTVASGNVITVATTGGQTIDLAATATLNPLQSITVVSNGSNWWIV